MPDLAYNRNMTSNNHKRQTERGNVLFYILIAVALLGALSFAVAQSGRGNVQQLSEERARLLGTEILEYSNLVSNALTQLTLRGCDESELNFDNPVVSGYTNAAAPTDGSCDIFGTNGGGLSWQEQDPASRDATNENFTDYQINATNNIPDLRSFSGELIFLAEVNQLVCTTMNDQLGVSPADPPNVEAGMSLHTSFKFTGSYSQVSNINSYGRELAACFEHGPSGRHYYYKVLLAR